MKKSLLAIALAAATMPLTFAQATPAAPATSGSGTQAATTVKTKKHVKKSKKAPKKNSGAAATNPSK
jgi:opacity protein-like surface antigen